MRATARGERPSAAKASSTCASFARSLSLGDTTTATPATSNPSPSNASGQTGTTPPIAAPATRSENQNERIAPTAALAPPTVQIAPSRPTTRAKRTRRTALPRCAGAVAFSADPTP